MDEPEVRFLWPVPITERELEFKKQQGAEALEQRFEEAQFNYLVALAGAGRLHNWKSTPFAKGLPPAFRSC